MNPQALFECFSSASCIVTQMGTGLIVGSLLFLVAAGLTLIFGVMGLINLAHGSFYMIGAFFAALIAGLTGSFWLALLGSLIGAAIAGVLIEIKLDVMP